MLIENFAIIIPVFNEEMTIKVVIERCRQYTENILVIDDGSTDNTTEILKKLNVKMIHLRKNKGKGFALHFGFLQVLKYFPQVDWIITMDGDEQHDPNDIPRFLNYAKKTKSLIVIGNRFSRKTIHIMPHRRYLVNKITTSFVNKIFKLPVRDLQCGYRLYHKKIIGLLLKHTKSTKFQFETEILLVAWFYNISIGNVSIKQIYNGKRLSYINGLLDTIRWIKIVALAIIFFPKNYSLKRKKAILQSFN